MQQSLFDAAPLVANSASQLSGIARTAAASPRLEGGKRVQYFAMPVRGILNRCAAARMPFDFTINPYRGCEFACKYCYARYTHEYMQLSAEDFENRIFVKQDAAGILRRELRKAKPGEVGIGTATDIYQPAERRFKVTRDILRVLAEHASGFRFSLVTKSNLVTRDIDLFQQIARRNALQVNLTLTKLDDKLARALEPRAPRPDLRLRALGELSRAGLCTGVFAAPVLPGINDSARDLDAIAREARAHGARHFLANPLFLAPSVQKSFLPFLEKQLPSLAESYKAGCKRGWFVLGARVAGLKEMSDRLRRKYGLTPSMHGCPPQPAASQTDLF